MRGQAADAVTQPRIIQRTWTPRGDGLQCPKRSAWTLRSVPGRRSACRIFKVRERGEECPFNYARLYRNQMLDLLSYLFNWIGNRSESLVRPERLELPTYWFEASRSIQMSYGRTRQY